MYRFCELWTVNPAVYKAYVNVGKARSLKYIKRFSYFSFYNDVPARRTITSTRTFVRMSAHEISATTLQCRLTLNTQQGVIYVKFKLSVVAVAG